MMKYYDYTNILLNYLQVNDDKQKIIIEYKYDNYSTIRMSILTSSYVNHH